MTGYEFAEEGCRAVCFPLVGPKKGAFQRGPKERDAIPLGGEAHGHPEGGEAASTRIARPAPPNFIGLYARHRLQNRQCNSVLH